MGSELMEFAHHMCSPNLATAMQQCFKGVYYQVRVIGLPGNPDVHYNVHPVCCRNLLPVRPDLRAVRYRSSKARRVFSIDSPSELQHTSDWTCYGWGRIPSCPGPYVVRLMNCNEDHRNIRDIIHSKPVTDFYFR